MKLHKDSSDSTVSSLDIFHTPFTQTSVQEGEWIEVSPLRDPGSGSQIEFEIESTGEQYLDLSNTLLHVQCQVRKKNGGEIAAETKDIKVIPSENFLHSLFQTVSLEVNNTQIEYEANYPHRAFLENAMNNSTEYKETSLATCGWFNDELNSLSSALLAKDNMKEKVEKRKKMISSSRTMDLMGKLHISLFQQPLYMLPNTKISVKFIRSSPALSLMRVGEDESEYSIKILKADLILRRVKIHPSIVTTHNTLLNEGKKSKYTYNHVDTQFFTISPGRQSQKITVYQNRLEPKRLFLCLIDHEAKNGTYTDSGFNLQHFDLSSINLVVNGHTVPVKPIKLNFGEGLYMRAYLDFQMSCGKIFTNQSNGSLMKDMQMVLQYLALT